MNFGAQERGAWGSIHLVIEHLGLARLGFGNEGVVQDVEDILADLFEFGLDLLAVFADGGDVFVCAFGFFLLLNGGDDAPGSTACADDILVGHREEVSLVNRQLAAHLRHVR